MLGNIKLYTLTLIWLTCIGHDVCSAQSLCEGGEATVNTDYKITAETGSYRGFVWVRPSDDINVVICNENCSPAETGYSATKNDTHSTLTIASVMMRDAGMWRIQDARSDTTAESSVCNLTLSEDVSTTTSSTPADISAGGVDVSTTTSSTPTDSSTGADDVSTSTPADTSTQNGTSSSMTTAKPEDSGQDSELPLPLYLIIIIAVGAALLIAIIIIIICIVRWRRKCEKYGVEEAEKSYKAPKEDASPVQNICEPFPANGEIIDTTLATVPKDDEEMVLSNGMLSQTPDVDEAGGMDETSLVASQEAGVKGSDDTDGPVCDEREDPGDGESDRENDVATTEADAVSERSETAADHTGLSEDGESNTPVDLADTASNEGTAIGSMFEGLEEPSEEMPQEQDVSEEPDFPPRAGDSSEEKPDTQSDGGSNEDGNGAFDNSLLDESVLQELSALGDSDSYDVAGATNGDHAVYVPDRAREPE